MNSSLEALTKESGLRILRILSNTDHQRENQCTSPLLSGMEKNEASNTTQTRGSLKRCSPKLQWLIQYLKVFVLFLLRKIGPEVISVASLPSLFEEDCPWANICANIPLFCMWAWWVMCRSVPRIWTYEPWCQSGARELNYYTTRPAPRPYNILELLFWLKGQNQHLKSVYGENMVQSHLQNSQKWIHYKIGLKAWTSWF